MPGGSAGTAGQILVSQGAGTPPQWQQPGPSNGLTPLCSSPSANYVQKWTGTAVCNSQILDNGINVGIGLATPAAKLDVNGYVQARTGYGDRIAIGGDNAGNPSLTL